MACRHAAQPRVGMLVAGGDLNAGKDAPVTSTKKSAEARTLDITGNWSNCKKDDDGDDTCDLDQDGVHNAVNETTQLAGSSTNAAHDRAGNMTKTPKPDDGNTQTGETGNQRPPVARGPFSRKCFATTMTFAVGTKTASRPMRRSPARG